jgi:hypothetical protein
MVRDQTGPEEYAHLRDLGYTRLFFCPGGRGAPTACDIVDLTAP